jgi:hypothetical protein
MKPKDLAEREARAIEAMAVTIAPLMPEAKGKLWGEMPEDVKARAREAAEASMGAREAIEPEHLRIEFAPKSPREALLMILEKVPSPEAGDYIVRRTTQALIRDIALEGLTRSGDTFAVDELADAVAEAHKLLMEIRDLFADAEIETNPLTEHNPMLPVEIDSALALPVAIYAMVQRRLRELLEPEGG